MADSVEECVYTLLNNDAVFMGNFQGVYWIEADTDTYPFITFWLVDDTGAELKLNAVQGEARIQFDLWDNNKIRSARLRKVLADKVREINDTVDTWHVMTSGINELTLQRESNAEPYHAVVDGIIRWWRDV